MLEARNSGNWNPRSASALIAFKPRQVLLAEHNNRNKMKMKTKDSKAPLNPEQKTLLLHSVLRYIERSGFSKTLKRFLSEAQIENDNWKAALLDLEDLFCEYSDKCNADRNLDIYKEQELQTDGTSKIDGNINTSASKETIKKKKKKRSDDSDNKAVEDKSEATDEKLTESAKSAEDISNDMISESKVKSKGTKKSKKSSDSPGQTEQIKSDALEKDAADSVCELQMDESSKKHKDQKKKKSVLVTESSVNTPEFEAEVKPKDKKKKNKQSNDSLVEDVLATNQGVNKDEPVSDSAFQSTPDNPLEEKKVKSKDKKGKKVGSVSEVEVLGQETPIKLDSVNEYFRSSDDTIKKDKKSSKRKQLASDENEYEPVKEEATEERKRRKTEALEEAKNEDQLTTGAPHKPSLTQLHTHGNEDLESNGREKTSIDQLNEHANGNLENNGGDKSARQKSARKQNNGSAEPKTANAFQRVKIDEVEFADEKLQDNSYWAKDGAEVGYGAKAQEILGQVRGRDFRHEKTKKKRGSYRGGQIDLNSHSIKFNYSDED